MKALAVAALAAAAALASLPAAAQPLPNEISVAGWWDDVREPVDTEVTNIQLRYGRFVRPQIVATAALTRSSFEAPGVDTTATTLLVGGKWYVSPVPKSGLVPFLDAAVGLAMTDTGSNDSSDFAWEFGGGASYFLNESVSLDAGLRFYRTDTDIETRGTKLFVGLTARF